MVCPDLRQDKIAEAYRLLDEYMGTVVGKIKLNYYEIMIVYAMMDANIKSQNVAAYINDTVNRFTKKLNKEDEKGK